MDWWAGQRGFHGDLAPACRGTGNRHNLSARHMSITFQIDNRIAGTCSTTRIPVRIIHRKQPRRKSGDGGGVVAEIVKGVLCLLTYTSIIARCSMCHVTDIQFVECRVRSERIGRRGESERAKIVQSSIVVRSARRKRIRTCQARLHMKYVLADGRLLH